MALFQRLSAQGPQGGQVDVGCSDASFPLAFTADKGDTLKSGQCSDQAVFLFSIFRQHFSREQGLEYVAKIKKLYFLVFSFGSYSSETGYFSRSSSISFVISLFLILFSLTSSLSRKVLSIRSSCSSIGAMSFLTFAFSLFCFFTHRSMLLIVSQSCRPNRQYKTAKASAPTMPMSIDMRKTPSIMGA